MGGSYVAAIFRWAHLAKPGMRTKIPPIARESHSAIPATCGLQPGAPLLANLRRCCHPERSRGTCFFSSARGATHVSPVRERWVRNEQTILSAVGASHNRHPTDLRPITPSPNPLQKPLSRNRKRKLQTPPGIQHILNRATKRERGCGCRSLRFSRLRTLNFMDNRFQYA